MAGHHTCHVNVIKLNEGLHGQGYPTYCVAQICAGSNFCDFSSDPQK